MKYPAFQWRGMVVRAFPLFLVLSGVAAFAGAVAHTLNIVYWMQTAGLGPFQIVMAGTVLEAVYFCSQLPTGILADLRGRRVCVVAGYLLLGVGTLVQGAWPTITAIIAGTVITGVGFAMVDGAQEAWVSDEVGVERAGPAFTRAAQVGQVAMIAGILAATGLALSDLRLPVLAGGVVYLALGIVLAVAMPEDHFQPAAAWHRPSLAVLRTQLTEGVQVVRGTPVLLGIVGMVFFLGLGSEGIDRFWQPHLLANGALPAAMAPVVWFGGLSVVGALGAVAAIEVIRRRVTPARPQHTAHALVIVQIVLVAGVALFAVAGPPWVPVLGFVAMTVARAALAPIIATWTAAHTPAATRATIFSVTGQADAAGQILGGPPIGLVGEQMGVRAGLIAAAALMAPAIAFTTTSIRHRPAQGQPAPIVPGETLGQR